MLNGSVFEYQISKLLMQVVEIQKKIIQRYHIHTTPDDLDNYTKGLMNDVKVIENEIAKIQSNRTDNVSEAGQVGIGKK